MPDYHILVPKTTTNLITNPSLEVDANGWTAVGATIARVNTQARFGRYSLEVVTDGILNNEGAFFRINASDIDSQMVGSMYIRGKGKVRIRLIDIFGEFISKQVSLADDRWQRIDLTGRSRGTDNFSLYIETSELQAITFYVDGAQIEEQSVLTSYCDGTLSGCRWNGVGHASTSTRNGEEMTGGEWVPIRDDKCNPDIYVTLFSGFGLPPVVVNRQDTALTPGAVFDNLSVEERVLLMTIWTKNKDATGRSQARINELRQTLIDLVKPDVSPNTDPFILRVSEDENALMIKCRYESGLEFDSDARNIWTNSIPLRLIALDPFWEEDSQEVAILDFNETIGNDVYGMARIDGEWDRAFNDLNDGIFDIIEDPNGRIYACGPFTADGDGNAVVRFGSTNDDFSLLVERGSGLDNAGWAMAAHPNGKVYVLGFFDEDNIGTVLNSIGEYDPVADTFGAMGTGLGGWSGAATFKNGGISIAPNGDVYVCGNFTTAGGNPANFVARWDGGSWHAVGDISGLVTDDLFDIFAKDSDEVYVVGQDDGGGGGVLWRYDGVTWEELFSLSDAAANPGMNVIEEMLDGTLAVGGWDGDTADNSGVAYQYNFSSGVQLGETFNESREPTSRADIKSLAIAQDGRMFVCGQFDAQGSLALPGTIALWNGSIFAHIDMAVVFNNLNSFVKIAVMANGDVYAGAGNGAAVDDVEVAAITEIENRATKDVSPIITITGTGRLVWIENQTTGQVVYIDYALQEDETLEFDFREGHNTVMSNYRGSVPDAILPNSDSLFLAAGKVDEPKVNKIAVFIYDEVQPTVQLRYTPCHWSLDGIIA
jgi:hypothetical protein